MSLKVWLKFKIMKEDGEMVKMRIQDLPPERTDEAAELMVKYFVKDEPIRKATGFSNNPEALEEYREYQTKTFKETHNVMCCADDDSENPDILAISSMIVSSAPKWTLKTTKETNESKIINAIHRYVGQAFDIRKEFNITAFYATRSILVVPEYRGFGIAKNMMTVGRLVCAAHGMPMVVAWMTNFGSQIAAARDGWETVYEVPYDVIAQKHDLVFENVPLTIKVMVAKPHTD